MLPCRRGRLANASASRARRARGPLTEHPELAQRAAELLRTPTALVNLSATEAACVVGYMQLFAFAACFTLFRDGDVERLDRMLLVLEGTVAVDVGIPGEPDSASLSVVGPGSILGEMSVLDGAPRSATCVTSTAVQAAGLSRAGLRRPLQEHPTVAAALLVGIAARIADRLRALNDQLELYAALTAQLRAENASLRGGRS